MLRRLARRTVKVSLLGAGTVGTCVLGNAAINDDLDDIRYFFSSFGHRYFGKAIASEKKKVVILGSGWGAVAVVKKMDASLYDVKLVSPRPFFFYTPLLCGSTTGVVSSRSIIEPIRESAPLNSYVRASCESVDTDARTVTCTDTTTGASVVLPYDHLIVSVGAQPNTFGIPGVEKYGMFLKEVEHGMAVRKRILNCFESANVARMASNEEEMKKLLHFVVVGGGPTGVEFCAELSDFIKNDIAKQFPEVIDHVQVTLVEALPNLLTMFHKTVGTYVQEHLANQGVKVRTSAMVKGVEDGLVTLKNSDGSVLQLPFGCLVWVAGVGMRPFTKSLCENIGKEKGQTDRRGLLVDECLRVKGLPLGEVFAVGDCAVSGKPPTAQVAAQQGKYLGRMFRLGAQHNISDPACVEFTYNHQGTMAYIGGSQAAAEIDPNSIIKLGRSSITDHFWWRSLYGETDQLRVMGPVGFAIWRSVYFSKLFSGRNRFTVLSDWVRTSLFGRPVASPVMNT